MNSEQLISTPCTFGENGGFLLERELGRGGMGGVYLGRDKMLDRPVAVKVMLKEYGDDPEFLGKFKREAQAAARLIHPNIAQIYSFGISEGMPYIAMELVAGGSLDRIMRNCGEGGSDVARVMKICEQTAQALRCAADNGLVHGDVKPENILLDANGNAKLVDFGLAAMQKDTTEIWGTPYYIAPEKVRKEQVDFRADIYSLGGTIYHALCGVAPFEGEDANAVVRRRFEGMPEKPSKVRPGLSPQIDALVMKMLAFDPKDRYLSFEALLDDFKKVMAGGLELRKSAPAPAARTKSAALARPAGAAGGGKKMVLKIRKPGEWGAGGDAGKNGDEGEKENPHVKLGGFKPKTRLADEENYEDENENIGLKVGMIVGGVVLAIGLVAGGLFLLKAANESSNEAIGKEQIELNIRKAKDSLAATRKTVEKFGKDVADMAEAVSNDCEQVHAMALKVMKGNFPEELVAALKPGKTAELRAAEKAMIEKAAKEAEKEKAEAEKATGKEGDTAKKTAKPAAANGGDEEIDPASPEGQAAAEKAAAEKAAGAEAEKIVKKAKPAKNDTGLSDEIVRTMRELWEKYYGSQAAALKVLKEVRDLLGEMDVAMISSVATAEEMDRLAKATVDFTSRFEKIKAMEEVVTVQKAKGTIKEKGERIVKKTARRIYEEKQQAKREKEKQERLAAEKARQEAAEKERAERAAREVAAAKEKFDEIKQNGNFRQLDWKNARRQLVALETTTGDGEVEVKRQLKKVDMMASVQEILKRNLKGYVFSRAAGRDAAGKQLPHFRGMKVLNIDDEYITVRKHDAVSGQKRVSWQKFYSDYQANLCEVCNRFIDKGRENGNPRLTLKEQAEAMMGIALTMQQVFPDDASAAKYGEGMAKKAGSLITEYRSYATEIYPDLDFGKDDD